MTKEELATTLNGRQYGQEITEAEAAEAKAAGLLVVFGASDDLVELRGKVVRIGRAFPNKAVICDHCLKDVDALWKTRVRLNLLNLDHSSRRFVQVNCCAGCYATITGHAPDQRSRRRGSHARE